MEKLERSSFLSHTLHMYGTDLTQMAKEVTIFYELCNYVYLQEAIHSVNFRVRVWQTI